MKYIKISGWKIIDLSHSPRETINDPLASKDLAIYLKSYGYGPIVKQADSVEELCDYFAFENDFDPKYAELSFFRSVSFARLWAKRHEELIGYIVIEKNGVKTIEPVAKTNDEGEFELL